MESFKVMKDGLIAALKECSIAWAHFPGQDVKDIMVEYDDKYYVVFVVDAKTDIVEHVVVRCYGAVYKSHLRNISVKEDKGLKMLNLLTNDAVYTMLQKPYDAVVRTDCRVLFGNKTVLEKDFNILCEISKK